MTVEHIAGLADGAGQPREQFAGFRHQAEQRVDERRTRQLFELLDLQDQTSSVQRLRQWAVDATRPVPGETAIDVGSGTGTVAQLLAGLLDPGQVTGVEPNAEMRAEAERRAAAAGSPATFVEGVATSLPFEDATVDLVWCERVLQHLDDPQGAVTEMARVLRPGGRVVLLDSDHATRVTADLDLVVEEKLRNVFLSLSPNARAARHIPRQLRDAGLEMDADVGSAALVLPQHVERRAVLLTMVAGVAVKEGVVSEDEARAAIEGFTAAAQEGVAFSAVTMFGFVGRKP